MKRALLLLTLLSLSACGFSPVYGKKSYDAESPAAQLELISIANIPDREGQALRNLLIDRFYRNGNPEHPRYTLQVNPLSETLLDLDITKTADSTRGQLRIETEMRLIKNVDRSEVLKRPLRAITSYNILASKFSTRVAEENARQNALADIARQIEAQISLYLKR